MQTHSLKALYSQPAKQEFWKILKIARRVSVMKYIFHEIVDIQFTISCNFLHILWDNLWS